MKTIIFAIIFALAFHGQILSQGKETKDIRIGGSYYETATLEPTTTRIKSLKLPAGFSIAKFAEITNPRMLAVAPDGTVYVSQRAPGTISMLKDTNGDGAADVQKVVAEKPQLHGLCVHNGKPPKDLGLTNEDWARQSKEPVLMYTPHAAPMEMVFYTGSQFPAEYKNDAFVAFRGSWNRDPPSGYEVARIRFDANGKALKFEPFLTGFLVKGGSSNGKDAHFARLAGVAQAKDGSLLVSDDTNNIVYRVSYGSNGMPPIMSRDNISLVLPETGGTAKLTVTSDAFAPGVAIPDKYSAYFDGISPALSWSGAPANTKSYVLMMEDPDAALKPVTHWIVANIPANVTSLPENITRTDKFNSALQGSSITGKPGYYGPKPPPMDKPHGYHFQIFALDTMLNLPPGFNRQALLDAMKGHVIGKGEMIGMYQRIPPK